MTIVTREVRAVAAKARNAEYTRAKSAGEHRDEDREFRIGLEAAFVYVASQPQPVAQGEVVAWQYRCITEEGPSPVWHTIDKETYDRWMETLWSRMEFRELFASPTIPTGHRIVPVEPTPEMLEMAREVHAPLDGEDDDFDYEFTRTWKAMLNAAPTGGG